MKQFKAVVRLSTHGCERCDIEKYCFKTSGNCCIIISKIVKNKDLLYTKNNHLIKDQVTKKIKEKRW